MVTLEVIDNVIFIMLSFTVITGYAVQKKLEEDTYFV